MTEQQIRAAVTLPKESDFLRESHQNAVRVRNEVMSRLGLDAKSFERAPRIDGLGFLLKGVRVAQRAAIWRAMREHPDSPSFPTIAKVCGMTTHSPIVVAVNGKRV